MLGLGALRFRLWWVAVRDSLWFLPGAIALGAAGLAALAIEVDKLLLAQGRGDIYLAFGGGVEGARGVLGAIASSTVTVTGVTFSVTIVALQLASQQFSPRVLHGFIADRANQIVLGVFIGTFTYTLLVLRIVRSASDDGASFVPSIAVGIAIGLALVSVGFLIFFVHHAARSIQVSTVVDRAARETSRLIDRLFPDPIDQAPTDAAPIPRPDGAPAIVRAGSAGYLLSIDRDRLLDEPDDATGALVQIEPRIGEFVLPGATLGSIWPASAASRDLLDRVHQACTLGSERAAEHDLELGLAQMSDIAARALSPSINDPATAILCIDRLAELLVTLGNRAPADEVHADEHRRVRLITRPTSFDRAVAVALDPIIEYGAGHAQIVCHLTVTLERAISLVPVTRRVPLMGRLSDVRRTQVRSA